MTTTERAIAMYAEARVHKQLVTYHRQQLRARMDALNAFCAAAGIDIALVVANGGTNGHGRNDTQPR